MKCYIHQNNEAVGVCSSCFRAICSECAKEKGGKLICAKCHDAESGEEEKSRPRQKPRESALSGIMRALFPHDPRMPVGRISRAEMITPIFLIGLVLGFVLGIPVLNMFFFPIIILCSSGAIVILRAEGHFSSVVSVRDGALLGFITSLFAVFVSTLVMLFIELLFAQSAFGLLTGALPIGRDVADVFLKVIGLDKDLSVVVLQMQFLLKLILYPLSGAIGGWLAAKYMR